MTVVTAKVHPSLLKKDNRELSCLLQVCLAFVYVMLLRLSVFNLRVVFVISYSCMNFYRVWLYEQHERCLIRNRNCLPFAKGWGSPPYFWRGSVLIIYFVFCVVDFFFVFVLCFLPSVACVSRLSILDCLFGFPWSLLIILRNL